MTPPAHVLIVDDDPALLQALPEAIQLRMGGLTVDTADSAAAALERIAGQDYSAIVTDIKMPGADGSQSAKGKGCPGDQAGGRLSAHDPRRGRARHRQGARGPGDPSAECPTASAVHRHRLRRHPEHVDRAGDLRTVPAGRGRNPV